MKSTTVKIDGELLIQLHKIKPPADSLSKFVRSILQQAIRRKKLAEAGRRYAELLEKDPAEKKDIGDWEAADLAHPPRRRKR